uniref:DNA-3-methyladenine glycosylase 1 n=1 Tax=Aegilops tauschii TaxID=37682 RepID=N1QZB6_AEGTA
MAKTRSAAPPRPSAAATSTAAATARISFRSRKIVKTPPSKPPAAAALPPPAPPAPVLPALSAPGELAAALRHLAAADPLLSEQLATSAAAAIYARFLALLPSAADGAVSPAAVLALAAADLRAIGVSGRKAAYLHDLAARFAAGDLSESSVAAMGEDALLAQLTRVKGIGEWTVHMFMIFSLHRPDVLPSGDLGVRKGVQELYKLKALPKPEEMAALCERWRPYRSVGAWYMWRLLESKGAAAKKAKKGNASS